MLKVVRLVGGVLDTTTKQEKKKTGGLGIANPIKKRYAMGDVESQNQGTENRDRN